MVQRKPRRESATRRRRIQLKKRRDAGSSRNMTRDDDVLHFVAEQTYVRYDTAGEFLAPDHSLATIEPPPEQLADTTPSAKRPWPRDQRHRMMAVSRLANKLEHRGQIEILQPWADQPAWLRVTAAGLRHIGLDWPEIPFPEPDEIEKRLRHGHGWNSHNHLINEVRMLLARGGAGAPTGTWKGEREIETSLPLREKGTRRPHKPDGILRLSKPGEWDVRRKDGTVHGTVHMQVGQIIGIEVECTQKNDDRLGQILPDLLEHHDYVWYFCLTETIHEAVSRARKLGLETEDQRRRVRILKLKDVLP